MSSPVRDAIATGIASLERVQLAPERPFGFGTDLYCDTDLREDVEVDGVADPTLVLGLAIRRRLDCPRGALIEDPDYGIDLRGFLNRGSTAAEIRSLAGRIRSEITKDDRVDRVIVTVRPNATGQTLAVSLRVTPTDPDIDDFSLVLAVTTAQVLIDELRSAA